MNTSTFFNYLMSYGAYLLGAAIFILDQIKKFQEIADTSPKDVTYKRKTFWEKEKYNVIQIALIGIVSVLLVPKMFGDNTIAILKEDGTTSYSIPMKAALIPIQIIIGWTGGRIMLAILGRSKKELYKKVGLDETKE